MRPQSILVPGQESRLVTAVGFLAAASFVVMAMPPIHAPAPASFLVYEPSDVPALIGTFTMGPGAGLAIVALRNLLRLVVHPDLFGLCINTIASGLFVWVAGYLYRRLHTRLGAVIALACATVVLAVTMTAANAFLIPMWLGLHGAALARMLLIFVLPFNIVKGTFNSILVYLLYKRVSSFFPRA